MNRLFYDPETRKVSLNHLTSLAIIDEQKSGESVQEFIQRIDDKDDRRFKLDFHDNVVLGKQMLESNVYRGVVLEGIPATYAETCEIINNIPVTSGLKPDEINQIVSLKRAWEFLLDKENLLAFPQALDFDLIRMIHGIVGSNMESLKPNQVGELRKVPIFVGGVKAHDFGIPDQGEIVDDLGVLNELEDPVVRALEAFLYLCKKQMFRDGNKRTANLTANFFLVQNASGLLSVRDELVPDFKMLLIDWYDRGNKIDIMNFLLNKCYIYNYVGKAFLD